jgi:ABC-type molybdate transport system substrate-binding protein
MMNKRAIVIFLALVIVGCGVVADAAEVKVICANGMRDTVRDLLEQLESATGRR